MRRLEAIMGRPISAVLPIEIGGGNGLAPLIAAAELGVPVVDCDGMGRAFPESQMTIFNIRGLKACPSVMTASCGALTVIETDDNLTHERKIGRENVRNPVTKAQLVGSLLLDKKKDIQTTET